MTKTQIDEQIRIIEEATKIAVSSKDNALKFLTSAGIIKPGKKQIKATNKK